MNKASYNKFKEWLDIQPVDTTWDGEDVMQMLKGDGIAELVGKGAVRPLMAQFKNVEAFKENGSPYVKYRKFKN